MRHAVFTGVTMDTYMLAGVVAGGFNHVSLRDTLPGFYQHVAIPTQRNNTLAKDSYDLAT